MQPRLPTLENYDIRIAADGIWWHNGAPIKRPALVKLFASVLRREADGQYWLVTPAERGVVRVDDAPMLIIDATIPTDAALPIICRDNLDQEYQVQDDCQLLVKTAPDGSPGLYLTLPRGLIARFNRPCYYQLIDHALRHDPPGIYSSNKFYPLAL